MLDLKRIRENPDLIAKVLLRKNDKTNLSAILDIDNKRRQIITDVEGLRSRQNAASKEIAQAKRAGEDASALLSEMQSVSKQVGELQESLKPLEQELEAALLEIPNLPHESAPEGHDETGNIETSQWGSPTTFDFDAKDHVDIAEGLDIVDFKRAAKLSGAGFVVYVGKGARLLRALLQFCLDIHVNEFGYKEYFTPYLVRPESMTGTGQLPKFKDDMYYAPADDLYLIPTAEVPLTNLFRDETIPGDQLPRYLTGYTSCFRREAGSYGKDARGMNRVHQFDKVEMVKMVDPETSYDELEALLKQAETVLQRLGLHYRVLSLCAGDLSFAAAKCYDIELWAPGMKSWLEVSSCSNFEDFQARRANIRYKPKAGGKPQFIHTLNGSGVAMPRLFIALLENYQREDGSIEIPEALRPYMGGATEIR